jgi:hypothetical protein
MKNTFVKGSHIRSKKFFNVYDQMMYEHAWEWNQDPNKKIGQGDALWRTSLAYIAWNNPELKEGILRCFRKVRGGHHFKKDFYQAMRCTGRRGEDDVSRDHVCMALTSLSLNNDTKELNELASKIPYRISRRMKMTPDFWCWVKSLTDSKYRKLFGNLFLLFQLITLPFILGLNWVIGKILGLKSISNKEYTTNYSYDMRDNWNGFQKLIYKSYYMGYAFHLCCWQIYVTPVGKNNILKKLLKKLLLTHCEKENFLLRLLLDDLTVSKKDVDDYIPQENYRWQMRFDGSNHTFHNLKSQKWKNEFLKDNQLDKDILKTMYKLIKTTTI